MASKPTLVDRLVEDLRPVRRIWSPGARLALWCGLQLAVFAVLATAGLRPDVLEQLARPSFLLEVGALVAAGGLCAAIALRAAVPGEAPGRRATVAAAELVAASLVVMWAATPFAAPSFAESVRTGMPCALRTVALAALPWCVLLAAARRGAPLLPAFAGAAAGLGAFLLAGADMRLACALDEVSHLVLWHGTPVALGLAVSALLGAAWLGRWRAT